MSSDLGGAEVQPSGRPGLMSGETNTLIAVSDPMPHDLTRDLFSHLADTAAEIANRPRGDLVCLYQPATGWEDCEEVRTAPTEDLLVQVRVVHGGFSSTGPAPHRSIVPQGTTVLVVLQPSEGIRAEHSTVQAARRALEEAARRWLEKQGITFHTSYNGLPWISPDIPPLQFSPSAIPAEMLRLFTYATGLTHGARAVVYDVLQRAVATMRPLRWEVLERANAESPATTQAPPAIQVLMVDDHSLKALWSGPARQVPARNEIVAITVDGKVTRYKVVDLVWKMPGSQGDRNGAHQIALHVRATTLPSRLHHHETSMSGDWRTAQRQAAGSEAIEVLHHDQPPGPIEPGLLLPFMTVASKGGPHDDDSYTAGYEMGRLDLALAAGQPRLEHAIRTVNIAQADLLAMRHGYSFEHRPSEFSDWTFAVFTLTAERTGP